MKNYRVIIVDDDFDLRDSLREWLSNEYIIQCFESAETFLQAIQDFEFEDGIPSCILLDYQMTGMSGIELQSALKEINFEFPIVFMSGNAQQSTIIEAWRGGAIDFVLKPFTAHQISDSLKKLFTQLEKLKTKSSSLDSVSVDIPITPREAEVLLLLSQGHQQAEVAQLLGLSLRTIKMYRTFLKNKLNLNTLMELARFCDLHKESIKKIAESINKLPNRK